MRACISYHADYNDVAVAKVAEKYRCIDISNTSGTLVVFFPDDVPAGRLKTIADAINDALDSVRVKEEEAA